MNTPYLGFTDQNQDTVTGLYDFLHREYNPTQGRWISPDPAGINSVDSTNPQTWNRYAYVLNNPLSYVDPLGLDCAYLDDSGDEIESTDHFSGAGECTGNGGYWVSGNVNQVSLNDDGSYTFGFSGYNQDGNLVTGSYANYLAPGTNFSNVSAWGSALGLLSDFLTGGGDTNRIYDQGHLETRNLQDSKGAQTMNQQIQQQCQNGQTSGRGSVSSSQAASNLPYDIFNSATGAQVGAFTYTWQAQNDIVSVNVKNDAGAKSFFYHVAPNRSGPTGPARTIHQTFLINEANPCAQ